LGPNLRVSITFLILRLNLCTTYFFAGPNLPLKGHLGLNLPTPHLFISIYKVKYEMLYQFLRFNIIHILSEV
jgi:hypothetical protein